MSPMFTTKVPGIGGTSTHSPAPLSTSSPGAVGLSSVKHS